MKMFSICLFILLSMAFGNAYAFGDGTVSQTLTPATLKIRLSRPWPISQVVAETECRRSATFFERFNNGLKDWEPCDSYENSYQDKKIVLDRIDDTTFQFRGLNVSYSLRRDATFCIKFEVALKGNDFDELRPFKDDNDYWAIKTFCSNTPTPEFFGPQYAWGHLSSLENFASTLAEPISIELKPEN